ncbi:MAG TPA: glycosyltransferase family 9 protein [Syntrophobacteria bacterium]|nr:glycosyltransferase family 9 protein [Syntrophobacteria bacterium]
MTRILIIRPSALGDVVMASPMIGAIRRAYPQGYLAWLVEPAAAELLRHHPGLDEMIEWPRGNWEELLRRARLLPLGREICRFARLLRSRSFHLALECTGLLKGRALAYLSGAPERIGFRSREPGGFLMTQLVSRDATDPRISSEYRLLMETLGLPVDPFRMEVAVAPEARARVTTLLAARGVGGRYAVLCPFTTRAQKHWREERWAALALALEKTFGVAAVVLGGPGDRAKGGRLREMASARLTDLTGMTTVGESAAIIEKASLVIGVDTGLTHMGVAFERPTLALFGATYPYLNPGTSRAVVIYHSYPCSPCRRRPTCDGRFPCMAAIEIDEVVRATRSLLDPWSGSET